jgi:hypothetical protein
MQLTQAILHSPPLSTWKKISSNFENSQKFDLRIDRLKNNKKKIPLTQVFNLMANALSDASTVTEWT